MFDASVVLTTMRPAGGSFRVLQHSNPQNCKPTGRRITEAETETRNCSAITSNTLDKYTAVNTPSCTATPRVTGAENDESATAPDVTEKQQQVDIQQNEGCYKRPLLLKTDQPIIGDVNPKEVSKDTRASATNTSRTLQFKALIGNAQTTAREHPVDKTTTQLLQTINRELNTTFNTFSNRDLTPPPL